MYEENVRWVVKNFGGKLFRDYDSADELRALLVFSVMRTIDRARIGDEALCVLPTILDAYNDMRPSTQCVNDVRNARLNGNDESTIYRVLGLETARLIGTLVSS